ncbi:MAG: DNA translocase FtsK 4TM domain-containing protein, partial [Silvanigrellaceae bacterium]|nr:DNA translocase FtsK 4TM domain-containing protein [Silvanigrellaceae bacterium]
MPSLLPNKWGSSFLEGHSAILSDHSEYLPDKIYFREFFSILYLFSFFLLMTAVITYDPCDLSDFVITSSNQQNVISNVFGPFGANLAEWMYQLFGIGAILFSFVFFALLLNTLKLPKNKSRFWLRIFGFPQLIFCYLGLLSAIQTYWIFKGVMFYTGGYIG